MPVMPPRRILSVNKQTHSGHYSNYGCISCSSNALSSIDEKPPIMSCSVDDVSNHWQNANEKPPIMSCSVDDVSNHWQNASDAT
ncbi:hypothetical protein T4D_14290 [Trichinella pseudospiralis]|uniref:Uncharacterized protein n=1 Tax=Trichinella pseudospiralis TaxID=6337 RepID=A0A0V1F2F6_TRIPS|nr:hypothetical protein T4D_14290 [Trichinella pseudospiralis]